MYCNHVKRVLDVIASSLALIIFAPLLISTMVLLFFINKGNPFFIQKRPGKNEKIFNIIKFKSMTDKKDDIGNLLPDELRITKFGSLIRKLSIDELPQIINVLKGDMSIIGPRPLLIDYLPLYNDFQKKRHQVRPGISGWAQVNGRNSISWEEKFEHDVWYVENVSFLLDVRIFFSSLKKAFIKEGVNSSEKVNMPLFKGSNT